MPSKPKTLPPRDWERVREVFDHCKDLPPPERERVIDQAFANEPELRAEVQALIAAYSPGFMETPALPAMARAADNAPAASLRSFTPSPEPMQPVQVGRYLLAQRLGRGGMAEVFLAKTQGPGKFDRLVAVKRILPAYRDDEGFRQMFEYEAKLGSVLGHANIVHVYDFIESREGCLLAMEYVNGMNLAEIVRRLEGEQIRFPIECALHIISEICQGLEFAHTRKDPTSGSPLGVIHRDISPKNIMISFEGEVKIVDFGIAKARDRVNLTQVGTLRGTAGYMAPEAASGLPVDHRSDLFSTSVVLYELIAGKPLFQADNLFSMLRLLQECTTPGPAVEKLDVDEDLKEILREGLSRSAEMRYQSAAALRLALQGHLAHEYTAFPQKKLVAFLRQYFAPEIKARQAELDAITHLSFPPALPETPTLKERAPSSPSVTIPVHLPPRPDPSPARPPKAIAAFEPRLKEPPPSFGMGSFFAGLLILVVGIALARVGWNRSRSPAANSGAQARASSDLPAEISAPSAPNLSPPIPKEANAAPSAAASPAPSLPAGECLTHITSEPPGAELSLNGMQLGKTPVDLAVLCNTPMEVRLTLQGYGPLRQKFIVNNRESRLSLRLNRIADVRKAP